MRSAYCCAGSSHAEGRFRRWHAASVSSCSRLRDPEVLARFWCEVLDFVELDREAEGCIEIGPREGFGGPQPTIFLIRNDEPKHEHARLHVDLNPTDRDQDAELERLLAAGAEPVDIGQPATAPGTSSPIQKATSSACSRAASTHSDGVSLGVLQSASTASATNIPS